MRRLSRRRFLSAVALVGGGIPLAAVLGCSDGDPEMRAATSSQAGMAPASTGTASAKPVAVRFNADLHMVVDKRRALPVPYAPSDLEAVPAAWHADGASGQQVRAAVLAAMRPLMTAATADGVDLRVESAYRSFDEQVRTFAYWVGVMGETQARRVSAVAGHSEHQLGATVDFSDPMNGWQLLESFAPTPSGRWLAANAHRFGFAMSYPQGGEAITGYAYEPWHFRYVGVAAAAEWRASGKTLVEYLESLQARG